MTTAPQNPARTASWAAAQPERLSERPVVHPNERPGAAIAASTRPEPSLPWWRYPLVWMVLGGPAVVVVAALVTAYIAVSGADVVLSTDTTTAAQRPALQGRNHAATLNDAGARR